MAKAERARRCQGQRHHTVETVDEAIEEVVKDQAMPMTGLGIVSRNRCSKILPLRCNCTIKAAQVRKLLLCMKLRPSHSPLLIHESECKQFSFVFYNSSPSIHSPDDALNPIRKCEEMKLCKRACAASDSRSLSPAN